MDACEATLKEDTKDQLVPVQGSCFYCIPRRLGIILLAVIKLRYDSLSLVVSLVLLQILHDALLVFYLFGPPTLLYRIIIWIAITLDGVDVVIALVVVISVCVVLSLVLLLLLVVMLSSYLFGHLILLYYCIIWIAIILDVFDVVFALAVVRGVCVKNKRIMKVYYVYGICIFGPLTFMCCLIVFLLIGNLIYLLICLFIFFLIFMMQEYLNHLLKNEVLKMESGEHVRL